VNKVLCIVARGCALLQRNTRQGENNCIQFRGRVYGRNGAAAPPPSLSQIVTLWRERNEEEKKSARKCYYYRL